MKKEDYLKSLRQNEVFKKTLSQATSDKERQAIKAYTEDFLINFYNNVIGPLQTAIEKDPDLLNKVAAELDNQLITSGSLENSNDASEQ